MLKKEILDTLKKLAESSIFLIAIPFAYLWDLVVIKFGWEFSEIFKFVCLLFAFFFSAYSGLTILQAEKKDRAFEYLFSLPVSKMKIILYKLVPRLLILLVLAVVFTPLAFYKINPNAVFQYTFSSSAQLILIFLFSVFLSFAFSSLILGLVGLYMLHVLSMFTSRILSFLAIKLHIFPITSLGKAEQISAFLSALLLLIPLGIAFWITFKNLDMKPLKLQMKTYYCITLIPIVIFIFVDVLFYKSFLVWINQM